MLEAKLDKLLKYLLKIIKTYKLIESLFYQKNYKLFIEKKMQNYFLIV